MLKLSSNNVTDHLHTFFSDLRSFAPVNSPVHRRIVSCSHLKKTAPDPLRVIDQGSLSRADSVTPADRLRPGRLMEDGYSYKEKFIVRSYEVGINKTATVETIANLLQVWISTHISCFLLLGLCLCVCSFVALVEITKLVRLWNLWYKIKCHDSCVFQNIACLPCPLSVIKVILKLSTNSNFLMWSQFSVWWLVWL